MTNELIVCLLLLGVAACEVSRPREDTGCPTWKDGIAATLRPCRECHELDDYREALDRKDAIVAELDPDDADAIHEPFSSSHDVLAAWVACDAPYFHSAIHGGGVHDPDSPEFHGREAEANFWDLGACSRCHGEDFAGGVVEVSCRGCHDAAEGPGACDTCHGSVPGTAAHPVHVAQWPCEKCHEVPRSWDDPGHVVDDPGHPAEAFGFDQDSGRCDVACHGEQRPRWTGGPDEAPCGSCHGVPPPGHVWDFCAGCHPTDERHADGVVQVGRTDGCDGCHGDDGDPAPPVDVHLNQVTTARGVGAHRSHVRALHRISGAIACEACHVVPRSVTAAGHIDTPPPAEVVTTAGWNPESGTCANGCHGAARPRWTAVGEGEIACGTCHGVPPPTPPHEPGMSITMCATCHSATVTTFGSIIVSGPPDSLTSRHINGVVDVD